MNQQMCRRAEGGSSQRSPASAPQVGAGTRDSPSAPRYQSRRSRRRPPLSSRGGPSAAAVVRLAQKRGGAGWHHPCVLIKRARDPDSIDIRRTDGHVANASSRRPVVTPRHRSPRAWRGRRLVRQRPLAGTARFRRRRRRTALERSDAGPKLGCGLATRVRIGDVAHGLAVSGRCAPTRRRSPERTPRAAASRPARGR